MSSDIEDAALRYDSSRLLKLAEQFLQIPRTKNPHRTHPSAGLYYTHNNAYLYNTSTKGPVHVRAFPGRYIVSSRKENHHAVLVSLGPMVARFPLLAKRGVPGNVPNLTPLWVGIDEYGRIIYLGSNTHKYV